MKFIFSFLIILLNIHIVIGQNPFEIDSNRTEIKKISTVILNNKPSNTKKIERQFLNKTWLPIIECFTKGCGDETERLKNLTEAYDYTFGKNEESLERKKMINAQGSETWNIINPIIEFYHRLCSDDYGTALDNINQAVTNFEKLKGEKGSVVKKQLQDVYGLSESFFTQVKFEKKIPNGCDKHELSNVIRTFRKYLNLEYYKKSIVGEELQGVMRIISNCFCSSDEDCQLPEDIEFLYYFLRAKEAFDNDRCVLANQFFSEASKLYYSMSIDHIDNDLIGLDKFNVKNFMKLDSILRTRCDYLRPEKVNEVIVSQETAQEDIQEIKEDLESKLDTCYFKMDIKRAGEYGQNVILYLKMKDCYVIRSDVFIMPTGSFVTKLSNAYNQQISDFIGRIRREMYTSDFNIFIRGLADAQGGSTGFGDNDISIPYRDEDITLPNIQNFKYSKVSQTNQNISGEIDLNLRVGDIITSNYELAVVRAFQLYTFLLPEFPDKNKYLIQAKVAGGPDGRRANKENRGVEVIIVLSDALTDKLDIKPQNESFHYIMYKYFANES